MNEREKELHTRSSIILKKDTARMKLNDIIEELCEIAEKQEKLMKLWLEDK